jgi:hypothetical protein
VCEDRGAATVEYFLFVPVFWCAWRWNFRQKIRLNVLLCVESIRLIHGQIRLLLVPPVSGIVTYRICVRALARYPGGKYHLGGIFAIMYKYKYDLSVDRRYKYDITIIYRSYKYV